MIHKNNENLKWKSMNIISNDQLKNGKSIENQ